MGKIRVGLYGAGGIAAVHADAYAEIPEAELVAVCDTLPERADKLAAKHGARACYDGQSLVSDPTIDVIDICLPTYLHAQAVIDAARGGKHVLCEKPVALGVHDVDRMIAAVEGAGVQGMIAQVVRFTAHYQLIKDLLDRGELGRPLTAQLQRLSSGPTWGSWFRDPKLSGGALLDLHIHDLDYLYHLFGRPQRVYAAGLASEQGGWDQVLSALDYGDLKATAEASFMFPASYPFTATIRLLGDKGCVQYPAAAVTVDPQAAASSAGDLVYYCAGQAPSCPEYPRHNPYQTEIEYFIGCLVRGEPVQIATLRQAREVLEIAMAVKRSLETGQVVSL